MLANVEVVYENGVFRPTEPVRLSENQTATVVYEVDVKIPLVVPKLEPGIYPVDELGAEPLEEIESIPVPFKTVGSIQAIFVREGKLEPPVIEDE